MQHVKLPWKAFYVPAKKHVGAGLTDTYGRIYMIQPSGNLRLIKDAKAQTLR